MSKNIDLELKRIKSSGLERRFPYSRNRAEGTIELSDRKLIDFTNFDYLNLSKNQKVVRAAQQAFETHGLSQPSGRSSSGSLAELISAEDRVARFLGAEAALFFSSRNQALLSLLAALLAQGEPVAFDESCYAPIADGTLLLEGIPLPFSADHVDSIDAVIERASGSSLVLYGEGASPISGDIFPLTRLQGRLGIDSRINLIVDESYALGVIGERGSGAFEASGVVYPNVSFVGAFGFGIPGYGGFVAAKGSIIEYIKQTSRAIESEPPIPAGIAAGIEKAIDVIELDILARNKVRHSIQRVRKVLSDGGLQLTGNEGSPIIGVVLPSFRVGRDFVTRFLSKGVLVDSVGVRAMRKETPLLRIVISEAHTPIQIDQLLELILESAGAVSGT